jgi:hypothetical protein
MKKHFLIVTVFLAGACIVSNAQEFESSRSVKDQLKNNSVPGLQYAPAEVAKTAPAVKPKIMSQQLKDGTMPGVKFAPGTGSAVAIPKVTRTISAEEQASLSSSKPVTPAADTKKQTVLVFIPTQEEKPKEQQ